MRTEIIFDKVCDRQDLIPLMETRKLGLEPYMWDRDDMYWAKVHIKDEGLDAHLSYCINPEPPNGWTLSFQYGPEMLNTQKLRDKVAAKWGASSEHAEASQWLKNLVDAGYYDHGRSGAPNANYGRCPHCGYSFEKGTWHPHTYMVDWNFKGEKKIIYHHRQMEKTIKELGLTKQGVSALPDTLSLEEIGELKMTIVS